jgi:hypothetical protein
LTEWEEPATSSSRTYITPFTSARRAFLPSVCRKEAEPALREALEALRELFRA